MIQAESLTKLYRLPGEDIHALKGIDLAVAPGEFVVVMGPSGAGKTTLLNLCGGLDDRSGGTLRIGGKDWDGSDAARARMRRELVGFVFQEFHLLPQLTALENVALPRLFSRQPDEGRARELLAQVGLAERMSHRPPELSGGEMQRVAVARALSNAPKVLLADEPTGNLDTRNSLAVFELFRSLSRTQGLTILAATHNARLAALADRIVFLNDGRIDRIAANAA